jgi:hypothetical protein
MSQDIIKQVAFIAGRIIHQGTGNPIDGQIQITAREGPVAGKVLEDSTFAVSGDLKLLFPNLATQDYQLTLTIHADSAQFRAGFIECQLQVTIPMGSNFDPESSLIVPDPLIYVGTIRLHADPMNIRGRVVEARNPETPIADATIEVLHSGPAIPPEKTKPDGRYRFDDVRVLAPAQIRCSATGFRTQERILLIDFGKVINEEYFRLAPP